MRSIVSILIVVLFLLTATAAFAAQIESISSSGSGNSTVREMALYDPDPNCVAFFNQHKVLVYSRTSRNGEQTDVVRPGNFLKECFIGSDHKIHVRRCGNVAYQIGVEDEVVIPAGRNGRNGQNGDTGPQGPRGPKGDRGERGPQGSPGQGTVINNFNSSSTMSCQIGGAYAPVISSTVLMNIGWQPTFNLSQTQSQGQMQQQQQQQQQDTTIGIGGETALPPCDP